MKKLILALVLLWPVGAMAANSGQDLVEWCSSSDTKLCDATLGMYKSYAGGRTRSGRECFSFPKPLAPDKLRQAVLDFAEKRPDVLAADSASFALTAFAEAWPCKQ